MWSGICGVRLCIAGFVLGGVNSGVEFFWRAACRKGDVRQKHPPQPLQIRVRFAGTVGHGANIGRQGGGHKDLLTFSLFFIRHGCTLSFLSSVLDLRVELGRLTAIEHSIVADDPNTAMAQFALGYRPRFPMLDSGRIWP